MRMGVFLILLLSLAAGRLLESDTIPGTLLIKKN